MMQNNTTLSFQATNSKIQQAFDKAAAAYATVCYTNAEESKSCCPSFDKTHKQSLQEQTADLLFKQLEQLGKQSALLDLGCGPGVLWHHLQPYTQEYLGVDISEGMIQEAQKLTPNQDIWRVGDAHHIPVDNDSLSLVFSSLALQWASDPQQVAHELFRVLQPQGRILIATLTAGSLDRLQELQQEGLLEAVNHYPEASAWEGWLNHAGFSDVKATTHQVTSYHARVLDMLQNMKMCGAGVVSTASDDGEQRGLRTRSWVKAMEETLKPSRTEHGIPLNHQVTLLEAIKK